MASTPSVNATGSTLPRGWQGELCINDAGIGRLPILNTMYLQGRQEDDGHNHGYKGAGRVMGKSRLLGFSGS